VLKDNAETELAERQRRAELSRFEDEACDPKPAAPDTQSVRTDSVCRADSESEDQRRERRQWAQMVLPEPLWLAAVPEGPVAEIGPLLRECLALMLPDRPLESMEDILVHAERLNRSGAKERTNELARRAYQLLDRHAVARAKLTKDGEELILQELDEALIERDKELGNERTLVDLAGVYARDEAAALLRAITQWEAQKGGEAAAVAALVGDTQVSPPMGHRAYRAVKDMLQVAVRDRCGFVSMPFDPDK
jgi:hypothetical protein